MKYVCSIPIMGNEGGKKYQMGCQALYSSAACPEQMYYTYWKREGICMYT